MSRLRIAACLLGAALATTTAVAARIDQHASRIGFVLKTRWGQSLQGRFPVYEGEVATLADGRHQVRLQLSARAMEIDGHPTYTRYARGRGFFDADRHPQLEFVSEPYPVSLLQHGGPLAGTLSIRGIQRRQVFTISPASCARPSLDCDVAAVGSILRGDYGMNRWDFALSDQVSFSLRIRVRGDDDA